MVSALLTEKKAAKWDSLMKWIKESSETYDSDCDNGRDVDTIWDKLDSLDYQELNSKDLKIEVLDKLEEEYEINVGVEGEEILLVKKKIYQSVDEAYEAGFWFDGMTGQWLWEGEGSQPPLEDFPEPELMEKEEKSMGKFDFVDNCGEICRCNTKEEKQQAIRHISSMMDC